MIQPIDFVERRLGGQHGLQQERALVQLRHEVAADPQPESDARNRDQQRDKGDEDRMPQTAIRGRRVPRLIVRSSATSSSDPGRAGLRTRARRDRHQRQRQDERRGHRRDHRGGQRLIHAALDAGHAEQRQEDDDDDERREGDRPGDFGGRHRAHAHAAPTGRRAAQPMQDVLDHDDRGVDEQADGDRQTAERHRVQADTERLQQQPGERDRQRNRERDHAGRRERCRAARRMTSTTNTPPSMTARPTPPSADDTSCDWS